MGLAAELGYRHRPGNVLQRTVAGFASSRPGAWLFARTVRHLDTAVLRLSHGRHSAPDLLAGLPVLDITTTGRRSGQPRTSHLISVPLDDDLALLGTNFGQPRTPDWVHNLEAEPRGTVTYRGRSAAFVARAATPDERARVVDRSAGVYGGYQKYLERISGREVRVFVLGPAD